MVNLPVRRVDGSPLGKRFQHLSLSGWVKYNNRIVIFNVFFLLFWVFIIKMIK